jgi:hypothetical protein
MERECICRSDFSGNDGIRKIQMTSSETKYKYCIGDVDYFNKEPCSCSTCTKTGIGNLYIIEIAEKQLPFTMLKIKALYESHK